MAVGEDVVVAVETGMRMPPVVKELPLATVSLCLLSVPGGEMCEKIGARLMLTQCTKSSVGMSGRKKQTQKDVNIVDCQISLVAGLILHIWAVFNM